MNNYTVYMHISPSNKRYIGITCQKPQKRWGNGSGYKECPAFYKAIQKYGWENIQHTILFENLSKEEAERKEIDLIAEYKSNKKEYGYNIENGGNCAGTHSEEVRRKISQANKGKVYSDETLQKMKEAHKGQGVGEKNPFYGRHHSKEVREAHSEFMKGNAYNKDKHHTDEYKAFKSQQMIEKYKNGGNPRCKRVIHIENGKATTYYSLREASRRTGIALSNLLKMVRDQSIKNWRYEQ